MRAMGQNMSLLDIRGGHFQVCMLGLDNAGKSTALYRLRTDQYVECAPTIGFNCEKFKVTSGAARGSSFSVWDVGGQERLRPLWRSYVRQTDAVVFVVDSTDADRLDEARVELSNLLRCKDLPPGAPILLLANKQDLPAAAEPAAVQRAVGVNELEPKGRSSFTLPCCAVSGEGLENAFEHLYELIQQSRQSHKAKKRPAR